jgi:hypothetical protein
MFAIGQALNGHVNEEAKMIFKTKVASHIFAAQKAIAFYQSQTQATKHAMRAWTQAGIHLNVVKDVRKLISKLIWESREEALFK